MTALTKSCIRVRLVSAVCACVCLWSSASTFAKQEEDTVQALRYGVTLFHYYQQDYFNALTELLAAQQLQQLATHTDNAELLRGGISLSYGMDSVAEGIFQSLLTGELDAPDRNQAWFYLGKLTWQRNQLDRAADALAEVSADYQGALRDEADYLRASVSLRKGDALHAATVMEQIPVDSPWRYYLAYNLGAQQAAEQDWLGAVAYFQSLQVLEGGNNESKSLRDKAMTASGYALLAAGEFDSALQEFTYVRLHSPLSDRALLGYGWAALELEDYERALSPWQILNDRSLLSESVRESLLAVPYAYEQMGHYSAALAGYESAADLYESELAKIQMASAAFSTEQLPKLLGLVGEQEWEQWMFDGAILPVGDHVPYLEHLLTRHNFQLAMRELQDLYDIAAALRKAQQRLLVLHQVDADQQLSWDGIVSGERQTALRERKAHLEQHLDQLRRAFDEAQSAGANQTFSTPQQLELWRTLEHATELANSMDVPEEKKESLNLIRGLLIWQDSEDYPAQSWQAKKQMRELEQLANLTEMRMAGVEYALKQRQQSSFSPRIQSLQLRVAEQAQQVARAISTAESQLRLLAAAELQNQSEALIAGIGQSRLAVARLYDLASPEVPR